MILLIITSFLLIMLAGVANAVMDKLQFHYSESIFPQRKEEKLLGLPFDFWHPGSSWKMKYRNWPEDQRPRFIGAKTWLVWLTDGWHLFQMIMFSLFQIAVSLPIVFILGWPWWWNIIFFFTSKVLTGFGFMIFFDKLLVKRNKETL